MRIRLELAKAAETAKLFAAEEKAKEAEQKEIDLKNWIAAFEEGVADKITYWHRIGDRDSSRASMSLQTMGACSLIAIGVFVGMYGACARSACQGR